MKQSKISWSAKYCNLIDEPGWYCKARGRRCNEQNTIGLTKAAVRPFLICGFGAVESYIVADFYVIEPIV